MKAPSATNRAATSDEVTKLRLTIEGMFIVSASAVGAIRTLAKMALHECERESGKVDASLIVDALNDICCRAEYADNNICYEAEQWGLGDTDEDVMQRLQAVRALQDALNQPPPAQA
ncbi:MAG: hypothetical protein LBI48_01300 [Burkholderiaceae bacterium]|jgi:hypothetical protein|nr:hypothetical protein [Burkholderiaceae bacterium]